MTRIFDWDSEKFKNIDVDAELQSVTAAAAEAAYETGDGIVPETVEEVSEGARFRIPLLIPEGLESGDGRKMAENSLTTRDLPITLLWQPKTGSGHDGSFIVGRIDTIERVEGGLGNARGVFDNGPYGREAERLVRAKMLRGVSADLDDFEADVDEPDGDELADPNKIVSEKMTIKRARVMAATLVAKPAFQECTIELDDESDDLLDDFPVQDGVYEETPPMTDLAEAQISALAASAAPVNPPSTWFENPELDKPTPLTIDDDGRVYGHIATWETDHIGYGGRRVNPPRSRSGYAYFRTGVVRCAEGNDVAVGQLTLAGGHADLTADARQAVKHYDDTASAVADVTAGEDAFGIWVAGGLRPGVTPEQVRTLRASAPSGDWRPVGGSLELVAVCQVNVPGFPIARARVASGSVMALVAAGAQELAQIKNSEFDELASRVAMLEKRELEQQRRELASRFESARAARQQRLREAADRARAILAPELQKKAEMAANAEALRAKLAEFKLHVKPDFEEKHHPRDDNGRFKEVLVKLGDLFKNDQDPEGAGEVKQALERAEQADADGNTEEADRAAAEAEALARKVAERTRRPEGDGGRGDEGPGVVDRVMDEVADDIKKAISGDADPNSDDPIEKLLSEEVPEPIMNFLEKMLENLGDQVDPKQIVSRLDNRVREWLIGKGFESPEEMARAIQNLMQKAVQPNITQ